MALKHFVIDAGFAAFRASGLHKALAPATRGQGVILTFHRVRPWEPATPGFAPNRLLEITPEFLDETLGLACRLGFELVTLAEARRRLVEGGARFAALTFDDGYRDTRDFALPVLERHGAPFTVFFATGFIERSARLWWLELEESLRRLDEVSIDQTGLALGLPTRSPKEKAAAFDQIYWTLRGRPEEELLDAVGALARRAGVGSAQIADGLFMDWDEVAAFSRHPLVGVGAHSMSHRMLAKWPLDTAREEMAGSKAALETRLGREVDAFAYPVGDATSAGPREFELARRLGFSCAVTTRPGMLFPEHANHLTALPRVSVNGLWQNAAALEVMLSGAPFLLWNRGRRVNVA
ncbi:MAG: polysaccharide deacetylase family protein [Roseiarcus sp.]